MTYPDELRAVAARVMWFEPPEASLRYLKRFHAYLTYGTLEEILITRKYFNDNEFNDVLQDPPAGVFDARSWTYWNLVYGHNA
jgi:phospholipid N-methyltransferase